MKQSIITLVLFLCLPLAASSAEKRHKLHVDMATVYLAGASVTNTVTVSLTKGENNIELTNIAADVRANSLIVNATNRVEVQAVSFAGAVPAENPTNARIPILNDSIKKVRAAIALVTTKIEVLNRKLDMLESNTTGRNSKNLSAPELDKMLELMDGKMEGYVNERNRQRALLQAYNEQVNSIMAGISAEAAVVGEEGGMVRVRLFAPIAGNTVLTVTYATPSARWSPAYDIMVDGVDKPVQLYYKANVQQETGVDWDKVYLRLSTGNTTEGITPPVMNPWYVGIYVPVVRPANGNNVTVMAYKKPLVDRDGPESRQLASAEIATLPNTQVSDISQTTPGVYQSQRGAALNVSGARNTGTLYVIDGVQVQGTPGIDMAQTAVSDMGVNAIFDIDVPYTILSDGEEHMVAVKKYEMPATYRYYAIPKLDEDAFLQAQITNWEDKNLLPGPTNIFYESAYIGQGNLDIRNARDTMLLSLGRDKKVMIARVQDKKLRSVKNTSSGVRESFAYTITVRNTRKSQVNIIMQDQLPVSTDKQLEIAHVDSGDSQYNEQSGSLTWNMNVAPGETKKAAFAFEARYPKGSDVTGLR